jgi:hypothetical protein
MINVDTFFYIVGQSLRSLTFSKYYRHHILVHREYYNEMASASFFLKVAMYDFCLVRGEK